MPGQRWLSGTFHGMPSLLVAIAALWFWGCASQGGGGLTLDQVQTNLGWKMEAYREANLAGMFTTNQQQQVAAALQAYQAAFGTALQAADGKLNQPAPPAVIQRANELLTLLGSL